MRKSAFETARQAMASLDLFSDHFASSAPYQEHHSNVVALLRERGTNIAPESPREAAFYSAFADALEKLNGKL